MFLCTNVKILGVFLEYERKDREVLEVVSSRMKEFLNWASIHLFNEHLLSTNISDSS